MLLKYESWIKSHFADGGYGKCKDAVAAMCKEFAELSPVRGHYYCVYWGERTHWWCVDDEKNIIDPTAGQFPTKGKGVYVPLPQDYKEPTGRCPECGKLIFDHRYLHKECEMSYAKYVNSRGF